MPSWRDDKILELANQLTYSPAEKRREQLHAAMDLLPAIDPAKTYPWDFVHYRITSFQPRTHIDHGVAGKVLRADLASLIEFLSDTLSIKVEEAAAAGDAVLEFDEVSRKFNVSSKTIQRWRKQGLVALRYLYADGRRRLGFLESAVARFAAANKERLERTAAVKPLSDEEKSAIIHLARALVAKAPADGICIKTLSRHIALKFGRAPETIRYTIRKYDQEHPEAAIFPEADERPRRTAQPAGPASAPTPLVDAPPDSELRTQNLELRTPNSAIEYVPNPLFDHPDADNIILHVLPAEALARAQATVSAGTNVKTTDVYMARMPRDLPAFLADIFRQPIMPQELETDAFRRMNYLKHKAAKLQASLTAAAPSPAVSAEIASLVQQSHALKNALLAANLRVAVHVARKHQRPDRPLIELVSDATIWVMRAIEKYDFSRPTRFSTYAGYAIMKNFARDRAEQLTRRDARLLTGQDEWLDTLRDPRHAGDHGPLDALAEQLDSAALQSDLRCVIDDLPPRDRDLLARHYGLGHNQPPLSLSQIGDEMGLTKARVRQLEARALRKLRLLMEARREKLRRATAR
jgi:RNA polymerase sigma factor (sigma-70 family)